MNKVEFKEFLTRLSCGESSKDDWQNHVVTHYQDPDLESCRINCVRLFMGFDGDFKDVKLDPNITQELKEMIDKF